MENEAETEFAWLTETGSVYLWASHRWARMHPDRLTPAWGPADVATVSPRHLVDAAVQSGKLPEDLARRIAGRPLNLTGPGTDWSLTQFDALFFEGVSGRYVYTSPVALAFAGHHVPRAATNEPGGRWLVITDDAPYIVEGGTQPRAFELGPKAMYSEPVAAPAVIEERGELLGGVVLYVLAIFEMTAPRRRVLSPGSPAGSYAVGLDDRTVCRVDVPGDGAPVVITRWPVNGVPETTTVSRMLLITDLGRTSSADGVELPRVLGMALLRDDYEALELERWRAAAAGLTWLEWESWTSEQRDG